jgi:hypothetical protein
MTKLISSFHVKAMVLLPHFFLYTSLFFKSYFLHLSKILNTKNQNLKTIFYQNQCLWLTKEKNTIKLSKQNKKVILSYISPISSKSLTFDYLDFHFGILWKFLTHNGFCRGRGLGVRYEKRCEISLCTTE